MTDRLAVGTDYTPGNDFTVQAGVPITLCLKGPSTNKKMLSNCKVGLFMKDGTNYHLVDYLGKGDNVNDDFRVAMVLSAPGTYRLERLIEGEAVGVFSNA